MLRRSAFVGVRNAGHQAKTGARITRLRWGVAGEGRATARTACGREKRFNLGHPGQAPDSGAKTTMRRINAGGQRCPRMRRTSDGAYI